MWEKWRPGDPLYVVGWESPSGDFIDYSLSPSREHAGWMPYVDGEGVFWPGLPKEAAEALLAAYQFAHRFPKRSA